jgi:hypothetical protein
MELMFGSRGLYTKAAMPSDRLFRTGDGQESPSSMRFREKDEFGGVGLDFRATKLPVTSSYVRSMSLSAGVLDTPEVVRAAYVREEDSHDLGICCGTVCDCHIGQRIERRLHDEESRRP